jgi:hypothetical protein
MSYGPGHYASNNGAIIFAACSGIIAIIVGLSDLVIYAGITASPSYGYSSSAYLLQEMYTIIGALALVGGIIVIIGAIVARSNPHMGKITIFVGAIAGGGNICACVAAALIKNLPASPTYVAPAYSSYSTSEYHANASPGPLYSPNMSPLEQNIGSAADVKYCPACSAMMPANARFCPRCGANVVVAPGPGSDSPTVKSLELHGESTSSPTFPTHKAGVNVCPICGGDIVNFKCDRCWGKLCRACGHMNMAMSLDCDQCGSPLP